MVPIKHKFVALKLILMSTQGNVCHDICIIIIMLPSLTHFSLPSLALLFLFEGTRAPPEPPSGIKTPMLSIV